MVELDVNLVVLLSSNIILIEVHIKYVKFKKVCSFICLYINSAFIDITFISLYF